MKKTVVLCMLLFLVSIVANCKSSKGDTNKYLPLLLGPTFYGNAEWARSVVVTDAILERSWFNSVSAGSDGIYVAGGTSGAGTYTFGTQSVTVAGIYTGNYTVLVKYDTSGNALWAGSVAGPSASEFKSVAVGSDGIYAVGYITGTLPYTFGTKDVAGTAAGGNAVLVKYDTSGNAIWARSVAAGTKTSIFMTVAVGSDGIYAAGYITDTGTYTFGTQDVHGTYVFGNAVLVKYDTNGNALWARSVAAGTGGSQFNSVAAGSDGIYAVGYIGDTGTFTFGTHDVAGTFSLSNIVLVKYDTNGNTLWAKSVLAGTNSSEFNSVVVGSDGIYAAGYIIGAGTTYTFDTHDVAGTNALYNSVLVKYDANGNAIWARSVAAGSNDSRFSSVAAGSDGIYAGGWITGTGTYTFGTQDVAGTGNNSNVVLVKYQ
jgi:outer membrane protein assembly factor BamB